MQLQGVITIRGDSAPALAHEVDLGFQTKVGITMILDLPFVVVEGVGLLSGGAGTM